MESEAGSADELLSLSESGLYLLDASGAVFIDPVRALNQSYTRFRVSPSTYYCRTFDPPAAGRGGALDPSGSRKRKRNKMKKKNSPRNHNERERSAERRHQEARPLLLKAHESLLRASELLNRLPDMVKGGGGGGRGSIDDGHGRELDFVELGSQWQAPLFEMSLCLPMEDGATEKEGSSLGNCGRTAVPLFNTLTCNETSVDVLAELFNRLYILPRRSCFHMINFNDTTTRKSDLRQIQTLIPALPDYGFNLIVIDPPWENGSVNQKVVYPTLPNRYFLYLPVKQLAHAKGALVALWMTNREKLHMFVEKELFPAWGVTNVSHSYWLKVKPNGSLIGELDLFHHRPYERILFGYINSENNNSECSQTFKYLQNNQVIISIPGAHSRKPPLGKLLSNHIPGPKPARCLELFARELMTGWTSWGNEPLHFQDSRYFAVKGAEDAVS